MTTLEHIRRSTRLNLKRETHVKAMNVIPKVPQRYIYKRDHRKRRNKYTFVKQETLDLLPELKRKKRRVIDILPDDKSQEEMCKSFWSVLTSTNEPTVISLLLSFKKEENTQLGVNPIYIH